MRGLQLFCVKASGEAYDWNAVDPRNFFCVVGFNKMIMNLNQPISEYTDNVELLSALKQKGFEQLSDLVNKDLLALHDLDFGHKHLLNTIDLMDELDILDIID
jgi:hypothetical protein